MALRRALVLYEDAPVAFTDTLYVSVNGVKGWEKYFRNNAAFNLGEYSVAIEYDSDAHAWQETDRLAPTCVQFGWIDYVCADCGKEKREVVDKIAHTYKDGFCIECSAKEPGYGLKYEVYGTYCAVTGIGTCTDTDLIIPDTYQGLPVTTIRYDAFENCTSLQWLTIPASVTYIGSGAFYGCSNLEGITFPDSAIDIGEKAFYGTAYYNDEDNWIGDVFYIGKHLLTAKSSISGAYTIQEGTKYICICDDAFENCSSLKSITIPDSVTSIGNSAFKYCSSLKNVYYTGTEEEWEKISIDDYNSLLTGANITYNYIPKDDE